MPSKSDIKTGRFTLDNGIFYGHMQPDVDGNPKYLTCYFKIQGDPSNLDVIERCQAALALGRVWHASATTTVGWNVTVIGEMLALCEKLTKGSDHPRWPVVQAWRSCLELTTSQIKRSGRTRPPFEVLTAERNGAVNNLKQLNKRLPPDHKYLPKDLFS